MTQSIESSILKLVFTKHALERLEQRNITQEMVLQTMSSPDKQYIDKDEDVKFIRWINRRQVHVIALYLSKDQKWLIKSVWVRGENDKSTVQESLWFRLLRFFGFR